MSLLGQLSPAASDLLVLAQAQAAQAEMPLRRASSAAEVAAFIAFAAVALAGALATVAARNPIRAAVGLFFHILALAGLYIGLGAHFLGVIQLLVYAGAVVVLFVFVIMLLGPDAATPRDSRGVVPRVIGALSVVAAAAIFVPTVGYIRMGLPTRPAAYGTLRQIGQYLFRDAMVPFELVGVLLVAAVVGAFAVARGHHKKRDAAAALTADGEVAPAAPGSGGTAVKAGERVGGHS